MKINLDKLGFIALIASILFLLLFSCKSKQTTTERTILSDTLRTVQLETKTKPIDINYKFDLKCDSLGNVTAVDFNQTSGENTANLKIKNNQLLAQLKVAETSNKIDTIYKTKFKYIYKDKEVIRYKVSPWHWLGHLIGLIIIYLVWKFF